MKKIVFCLLFIAAITQVEAATFNKASFTTGETGKRATTVPAAVLTSYNTMYPGAQTIKWSRKGETRYQVVFIYNGQKMTASYAPDGTYLGA